MQAPQHRLWIERGLLAGLSAAVFVPLFHLNDWLFQALEYAGGVSWVFLPAGFRVLLVLALGTPGAVGIMLGNWWIDRELLDDSTLLATLLTGVVSGFSPWLVRWWMIHRRRMDAQLRLLGLDQLLEFVLFYAALNALGHQFLWSVLPRAEHHPWVEVWPMFVGDVLGALLVFVLFRFVMGLRSRH